MGTVSFDALLEEVRACRLCEPFLAAGARPVLQIGRTARVLVAGQAPGRRVHESGVPFADASGDRLREWMGVSHEEFYDPSRIAILPMGFCYPGTGRSGDLPPRPECAATWRRKLLEQLPELELTVVLGLHAARWHLGTGSESLTQIVRSGSSPRSNCVPLPHPSPRNQPWTKRNPWFASEVLPSLRRRVRKALG